MEYLNLLVDTKKEFTSYLISYLYPEINKGIDSIYLYCKKTSIDNKTNILFICNYYIKVIKFQILLHYQL